MTPARIATPLLALVGLVGSPAPASAAWDNVFQVCCHDCKPRMSYSQYAGNACNDCAPAPAPQPSRKVEYQQRSYYEPITVMKPEKYLEPVEVKSKSYYWEPVTSYTYRSYYDPCSGECRQEACPKTSYKLKEQCNTSMRYVERTRMVPVQSQRMVTESVPVVTYYYPPTKSYSSPIAADCPPGSPAAPGGAPRVDELRSAPPTVTPEVGATIPPTQLPVSPNSRPRSAPPAPAKPAGTFNAHSVSRPSIGAVRGEVVLNDQITPRSGAKLVFVSADDLKKREFVTADAFGNFDVNLPTGEWYVYLGNGDGKATYHKKISVADLDAREFRVVSR